MVVPKSSHDRSCSKESSQNGFDAFDLFDAFDGFDVFDGFNSFDGFDGFDASMASMPVFRYGFSGFRCHLKYSFCSFYHFLGLWWLSGIRVRKSLKKGATIPKQNSHVFKKNKVVLSRLFSDFM